MFSTPTVCRDCHSGSTINPQSANGDRSMIHALHWNFIVSVPHTQLTLLSTLTSLIGIKYPRPSLLFLYCKWQKAGRGYKTTSKTSTFKFLSITTLQTIIQWTSLTTSPRSWSLAASNCSLICGSTVPKWKVGQGHSLKCDVCYPPYTKNQYVASQTKSARATGGGKRACNSGLTQLVSYRSVLF